MIVLKKKSILLTTVSGVLQAEIDAKPDTLLELIDTPAAYNTGKYLKSTVSGTEWSTVSGSGGVLDHSELNELDYVSSGHIGFQPVGDYVTDAEITTISGNIVDQIPTDFYTTGEVDTISGSLSSEIDAKPDTLLGLTDTPAGYDDGKVLTSTASGTEWLAQGYTNLDGGFAAANYGAVPNIDGGDASSF